MEHKQLRQICTNADTAILFIHGIVGTPNHFRIFLPLIPEGVSVWNLLLDGHGKKVRDFSKTSMQKWEAQVSAAVDELSRTHKEIIICAHSMGTLFAIEQAVKNEKIKKLFLMAVPIKVHVRLRNFSIAAKILTDRIRPDDHITLAAKDSCSISLSRNLFLYLGWLPRYAQLLQKIRSTRKLLPQLPTPCTAYQSLKDELVSSGSVRFLKENSRMQVVTLAHSGHYYYEPNDLQKLTNAFSALFIQ